jgi:hypothetical protein
MIEISTDSNRKKTRRDREYVNILISSVEAQAEFQKFLRFRVRSALYRACAYSERDPYR